MVLKLIDICLNCIVNNLNKINDLNINLTGTQKELIIQRLSNHALFDKYNLHTLINSLFTNDIKILKFYKCDQIDDTFMRIISKNARFQLRVLSISRCLNLTDLGLKELLETQKNVEELYLRRLNSSFTQAFAFFKAKNLQMVDLSFSSSFNDRDLLNLCKNNAQIKTLLLTHCSLITNDGMRNAFNYLTSLECLDIEGIKGIDESSIVKFKNMKKLSFYGSDHLNSSSLKRLFDSCNQLKELNILYSWSSNDQQQLNNHNNDPHSQQQQQQPQQSQLNGILTPNTQFNNSLLYLPNTLECLALFRPNIKDPQILVDSLKRLKSLRRLSLHCVECINDQALTQVLEVIGQNLLSLDLGGYMAIPNRLTDTSIKSIAKYCKNLEHICLDLFSSSATLDSLVTLFTSYDDTNSYNAHETSNNKRAFKLKTIRLSACRKVSYDLLLQISLNCVNLTHLDVSGLNELVDDNLIEMLASNAPKLANLDLKACVKITDRSICEVAIKCPIMCLVLSGLNSLTDKIIFVIANNLQSTLKEIYLSGCSKISHVALRYLADCCINKLSYEHKVPNLDPNQLMAKNLDTGVYERVDQFKY